MSQQIKIRIRTVNEKSLKELDDQQLQDRIKMAEKKLESKRVRYETIEKLNAARLQAYRTFRTTEMDSIRRILSERSKNGPAPKGNVALPAGVAKVA